MHISDNKVLLVDVVKVQNMGGNATRFDVQDVMQRYGGIKFIEMIKDPHNKTLCNAIVRFDRASSAATAMQVRA